MVCMLFACKPLLAQWTAINFKSSDNFDNIQFLNDSEGFMNGNHAVLQTTNAALSWDTLYSDNSTTLIDLFFLNKTTGFFTGQHDEAYFLNSTIDGGKSWKTIPLSFQAGKIYFVSSQIGFMGTAAGRLFKTVDGGVHWEDRAMQGSFATGDFFFLTDSIGFYTGWYAGVINKTINQGTTWIRIDGLGEFNDIFFPSLQVGYTVGLFGAIHKTTDQGKTWTLLNTGLSKEINLYSIHCTDTSTCYAVGDNGTIIKTTNGGANWTIQNSTTNKKINSIFCTLNHTCYAVGDSSVFLKAVCPVNTGHK